MANKSKRFDKEDELMLTQMVDELEDNVDEDYDDISDYIDLPEGQTYTENGAIAYSTTKNPLVDFNFSVSSFRNREEADIINMFKAAYEFDKEKAIKLLFQIRDVRGGKGERKVFNTCLEWLAMEDPILTKHLVNLIPEYGRYKDLVNLISTKGAISDIAAKEFYKQLAEDFKSGKDISLAGKWAPTKPKVRKYDKDLVVRGQVVHKKGDIKELTPDKKEKLQAVKKIETIAGINDVEYRKMVSALRERLEIFERRLSTKDFADFNFSKMAGQTILKYYESLIKIPEFRNFLDEVASGNQKINFDTINPHQIMHEFVKINIKNSNLRSLGDMGNRDITKSKLNDDNNKYLNVLWNSLPDKVHGNADTLVVLDTSGSMECPISNRDKTTIAEVASSMAIYCAEHQEGVLKDKYMTFSSHPAVVDISGKETLADKLKEMYKLAYIGYDTNIERVFNTLLKEMIENHATQDDIPKNLLIVSDMEFNDRCVSSGYNETVFESIQKEWEEAGYKVPTLVFWNVNTNEAKIPVLKNELGLVLLSSFSANTLEQIFNGDFIKEEVNKETNKVERVVLSPEEQIDATINKPRYDAVSKAYAAAEKEKEEISMISKENNAEKSISSFVKDYQKAARKDNNNKSL